jgi:hypothetical protein
VPIALAAVLVAMRDALLPLTAYQQVREFVTTGKMILTPNRFAYLVNEHFGSLIRSRYSAAEHLPEPLRRLPALVVCFRFAELEDSRIGAARQAWAALASLVAVATLLHSTARSSRLRNREAHCRQIERMLPPPSELTDQEALLHRSTLPTSRPSQKAADRDEKTILTGELPRRVRIGSRYASHALVGRLCVNGSGCAARDPNVTHRTAGRVAGVAHVSVRSS